MKRDTSASGRLGRLVGAGLVLLLAIVCLLGGTTRSAFIASVTNSTNTYSLAFSTCQYAEVTDGGAIVYALNGSGSNLGTLGSAQNGSLHNGSQATTTPLGCTRDPATYYATGGTGWVASGAKLSVPGTSSLTQEIWFKTSSAYGLLMQIGDDNKTSTGSTNKGQAVYIDTSGHVVFLTFNTSNKTLTSPGTYTNNTWHHVMAVYAGGTKSLYIDGVLVASATGQLSQDLTGYWRIAGDNLNGYPNVPTSQTQYNFNGSLEWAALYTKALTAQDAKSHYLAGP